MDNLNKYKEVEKNASPAPWKSLIEGRDIESGSSFIEVGNELNIEGDFSDELQDCIVEARNALSHFLETGLIPDLSFDLNKLKILSKDTFESSLLYGKDFVRFCFNDNNINIYCDNPYDIFLISSMYNFLQEVKR